MWLAYRWELMIEQFSLRNIYQQIVDILSFKTQVSYSYLTAKS